MTETVKCRVCGCLSPLGTAECPDCGAPLPQELPREETPAPVQTAEAAVGEVADTPGKERMPAKHPILRRVAVFLTLCLVAELALFALPQKQPPPGVVLTAGGFVTPDGVWDYTADGFVYTTATSDGRYVILQQMGADAASKTRRVWEALSSSSVNLSYTYAPDGDYYLFDGRTLERTDWDTATLTDNGTVFYTVADETGTTLSRRDLTTGTVSEIQRVEGETGLADLWPSADGTAVAYRWKTDGKSPYSLWRVGEKKPAEIGCEGVLWGVGNGGGTCLFSREYLYRDMDGSAPWGDEGSQYYLWRNGETVDLPDRMPIWCNNDFTEFLQMDYLGDWYYFDVATMTEGVKLDVPDGGYLSSVGLYSDYHWDTLTGHCYLSYDGDGNTVYYLTRRGELLQVRETEGLENDFRLDETGQSAVYLKNGDLYRAAILSDDTVEIQQLTQTVNMASSGLNEGAVETFAVNGDLTHIYYVAQSPEGYRGGKILYHWHDGESHPLDFQYGLTYNAYQGAIEVTGSGGCYFQNSGDVYYTEKDAPPTLILEDVGMGAQPQMVGPERWPLVVGSRWVDGENKQLYWRLDGANEPVELTAWTPKEGKVK